ncbi:hypothetical protein ACK1JC_16555 [Acinetobacter sp. TY2]|uniref:hypothetical protein n=1 Tax=Acinetobacter sp. TY2 TaxID=3387403 RepID=UPI003917A84D
MNVSSAIKKCLIGGVLLILIFLLFYFGNFYEKYEKAIELNEPFMRITVMIFSSIITVFAMIVALFKEDIRGFVVRPRLHLNKENKLNELTKTTAQSTIEAVEYFYKTFVNNIGNIPAKEVEVYLTNLKYKKISAQTYKEIEVDGIPLTWKDSESKQIMIPRNSKKSLTLFKIIPPSEVSTPDQPPSDASNQPRLQIGTKLYNVDPDMGEWIIVFSIYSDNAKPLTIKLTIKWDGKWELRLTEMSANLSVTEEIKYV